VADANVAAATAAHEHVRRTMMNTSLGQPSHA
jgi:hypothetical protein